jgi:hypothetical protein
MELNNTVLPGKESDKRHQAVWTATHELRPERYR